MPKSKLKGKKEETRPSLNGKVYLLWFVEEQDGFEDIELLVGVYATKLDAKAAIERVKNQPGFVNYQKGFQICPYELGRDHWTGGFIKD